MKKSVDISYIYVKRYLFISMYISIWDGLGMDKMVVMMDYRPTAVFGWFAIRDGHMKSVDIGLVVGTAIWMKVKRRSAGWLDSNAGEGRAGWLKSNS